MKRNRGSVLISVLWIVTVLSVISFSLASMVRIESASSQQAFDSERAFFMAKGSAEIVFNSLAKNLPIPANSPIREVKGEYIFPFDSGETRVQLEPNAGVIDLNVADDKLLASLFDSVGADQETRNRLVDSVLDWRDDDDIPHLYGAEAADYPAGLAGQLLRPRNGAFQSIDELLLVKNMTPEIFFGTVVIESTTGQYRRIPGIRDLIGVNTNSAGLDPNAASYDVLLALPGMSATAATQLIAERMINPFGNSEDLAARVPELFKNPALEYMSFEPHKSTVLVARATISASGVSRTVRLLLKRENKMQILSLDPLRLAQSEELKIDRWRF